MTNDAKTPGQLATVLGYEHTEPTWPSLLVEPIPPKQFGKDHYDTLLYVEHCAVDRKGFLDPEKMRTDRDRHPIFFAAKRTSHTLAAMSGIDMHTTKYPTRLIGGIERPDHDDYDCVDDMLAAGWLHVTMPIAGEDGVFRDSAGKPVPFGPYPSDDPITDDLVTGLTELWLAVRASFGLTDLGREVTTFLRKHKEEGGNYASFRLPQHLGGL